MSRVRVFLLFAAAFLFCASSFHAQQAAITPPRIVAPVDESRLVALKGSVPGRARAEFDRGRAQASTQLTAVRLVLSRTPEQEAGLKKLIAEQIDPNSPNYHKWLTPEQTGKLYGPSDDDVQTIVTWLQSHGFTVQTVSPAHISVAFSGSVSQVEAAFHTEIHSFNAGGEEFLANAKAPSIPAALAPVVAGMMHMGTLNPHPLNIPGRMGTFDSKSKRLVPVEATSESRPTPFLTNGSTGNYSLYVTPTDAAVIYNTPSSLNINNPGTNSGSEAYIGIGGRAPIQASTVTDYRKKFMGDTGTPNIVNVASDPATDTDDQEEAYLDNEISGGLAPGAVLYYYASDDLFTGVEQALTDNHVDVFSLSYGSCEMGMGNDFNSYINELWEDFAAAGITVVVSTGDSGAAGCDNPNKVTAAKAGLQVNGLASTPYNIAVGGTDYYGLLSGFTTYANTTNTSLFGSAKGYIPESTWNDSVVTDAKLAQNAPYLNSKEATNIVGGSGGASSCATSTSTVVNGVTSTVCSAGYPKPSWQTGAGVPADGVRDIPDVSLLAGNGADGAAWIVCTDDTGPNSAGVTVTANCTTQADGYFYFFGVGGTSTSAPAFAGIVAIAKQDAGGRLGIGVAKKLYDLYNSSNAAAVFHDVTQGNISVPCVAGTANCSTNAAGNAFLTGYDAGTGYDLATGLGSVDATQLVNSWGTLNTPIVLVNPSSTTITYQDPVTVTVFVDGTQNNPPTPTGTVTLHSGNVYNSGPQTLSGGSYSFTIPAGTLPTGYNTIFADYSGDSNYAITQGTSAITVNGLNPTVTLTPSATSIVSNQALSFAVKVTGTGPTPTGTVRLSSEDYVSSTVTLVNGQTSFTIPAGTLTAGQQDFVLQYSGDTVYSVNEGLATVQVTAPVLLATTTTLTPSATAVNTGDSFTVTVKVTGSGPTPTGILIFYLGDNSHPISSPSLSNGSATVNISANTIPAGTATLGADYLGDSNYAQSTGKVNVTVTQSVFTVSGTTPTAVTAGTSASSTITVTSATDYSGSVALTCALTTSPTGASKAPTCTVSGSPVTLSSSATSGTATVSFFSTAATATPGELARSDRSKLLGSGAATLVALLAFFGIPARRRAWRAMLGVVVLVAALVSLSACGSGGTGGGGGDTTHVAGTTSGDYVFTITAAGTPAVSPAPTTTVTLHIN